MQDEQSVTNNGMPRCHEHYGACPQYFHVPQPLMLECGRALCGCQIAYHTYGSLNAAGDNVIWVCHALTANSDAAQWWSGLIGNGKVFDPAIHCIVCANVLGSCYGTTGPLSVNPCTGQAYYHDFPVVTARDMAAAHDALRCHLGIGRVKCVIGGSIGGFQALEWCIDKGEVFDSLVVIAASACTSPWAIAISEAQRMALEADSTFHERSPDAGMLGMAAARAIGMLAYRTYDAYNSTQQDDQRRIGSYRAASYQRHQGEKLMQRFNALSYYRLSQMLDSHDISRRRAACVEDVLKGISMRSLIVGIGSDLLFPAREQQYMAAVMPNASYAQIDSIYGHDAFLIEYGQLSRIIAGFLD